ncbi:N-acetylmuramoyl-L-alanine amidase [Paraflavitalea sp. CAU 1676]|uniref:N-acetylmuramoyl-L-alanine amidase n=1 Tax=Paraflavitalea sp. CAU 1676 TaxID=3032598 RepID=UPI0023DC9934|nr:N-acetylmuramoyl-L-alanine amidase [Paraflavitalea sp. CAU 1676]MDF2193554.1 N-acetylmuramoyl-L-alanine amidase [Paraflavitalea sp. CAU 1676]
MKIKNHWLEAESTAEKIVISKTKNAGNLIDPDYLVIHYTATDDAAAATNWFLNTKDNPDKIAAHIVLDLDGTITQLVPFNQKANHAGTSTWDGVDNFNSHSIGIEIVNAGFVEKLSNGSFKRSTKTYPATIANRIVKAKHKHKFWTAKDNQHWFIFPPAQLQALYKLSKVLISTYQLVTAVGHDDISPARKPDPGPAFPWPEFKRQVYGADNPAGNIFTVNTEGTNLRSGASTNTTSIKKLAKGYEVGLIETNGQWSKVYLVDKKQDVLITQGKKTRSIKTIGWIFSSLLTLKP